MMGRVEVSVDEEGIDMSGRRMSWYREWHSLDVPDDEAKQELYNFVVAGIRAYEDWLAERKY